jgi:hypothetical protein
MVEKDKGKDETSLQTLDRILPNELKDFSLGEEVKSEVMSISERKSFFIKVAGTINLKKLKDIYNGGLVDRPFLPVVDLETGEETMIILPTMLESIFKRLGQNSVGHCYAVFSKGRGGKAYNQYEVRELKQPRQVNK